MSLKTKRPKIFPSNECFPKNNLYRFLLMLLNVADFADRVSLEPTNVVFYTPSTFPGR